MRSRCPSLLGESPWWLAVILLALFGMSLLAWTIRALDGPGAIGAFSLGLVVAGVGGLDWLFVMVGFTAIGVAATKLGHQAKRARGVAQSRDGERGLPNVIANGAAAGLAALASLVWPEAGLLAFVAALAVVTADTMASEIGSLAPSARSIVPPFRRLQVGQNGGVSWLGQAAAVLGASAIAGLAVAFIGISWSLAWIPAVAGFAGCQMDSVLGATVERSGSGGWLSNEHVNLISSLVPMLVVLAIA